MKRLFPTRKIKQLFFWCLSGSSDCERHCNGSSGPCFKCFLHLPRFSSRISLFLGHTIFFYEPFFRYTMRLTISTGFSSAVLVTTVTTMVLSGKTFSPLRKGVCSAEGVSRNIPGFATIVQGVCGSDFWINMTVP